MKKFKRQNPEVGGGIMTKTEIQRMHADAIKALRAAVRKAIARHESAGVPAVVWRDGKVVRLRGNGKRPRRRQK